MTNYLEKITQFFGHQRFSYYFSSQNHSGMKNTLLVFALITLFTASYQPLTAQLDNGEIAPDWTLTDINGNTHDLYDLLEAGKTVLIDLVLPGAVPVGTITTPTPWLTSM
jgi:hypothetical protein